MRLNPAFDHAHADLGLAYKRTNNFDAAISEFEEAIRLDPKSPYYRYGLGQALWQAGKLLPKAVESLQEAIRLKPDYAEAYYDLGRAYLRMGKKAEALQQVEKLKKLSPPMSARLYRDIAGPSRQQ